jgi:hypothetical protein
MHDAARAQGDGLHAAVDLARREIEHCQLGLSMATRAHRSQVVVGDDGLAYEHRLREVASNPPESGAEYRLAGTTALARFPQFDAEARAIHAAKAQLVAALDTRREALERVAALRSAVEKVEAALKARGWRGGELAGPLPRVANTSAPAPSHDAFRNVLRRVAR